jgi:lantibiotic leader peptide-processing serine protease
MMLRASKLLITLLILILLFTGFTAAQDKQYLILSNGQGKGSTDFAASISGVTADFSELGVVLARSSDPNFASNVSALQGVQSVVEDVDVEWLGPNEKNQVADVVADVQRTANLEVYTPIQWNLKLIRADQAAAAGFRGSNLVRARVAVIDSGIVTTMPDLVPNLNLALSVSFVPGETLDPPPGIFNHGTHVAGIIAASVNGLGIQGVASEAEIVAVKVLSANTGRGSFGQIIAGIEYASGPEVHADIINMSLGAVFDPGKRGFGPLIAALNRAVNHATARGTLVISAAGNDGLNLNGKVVSVPAQSGNGMAVSATTSYAFGVNPDQAVTEYFASYSNYGESVVGVAGPGGDTPLYGTTIGSYACRVWLPNANRGAGGWMTNPCYIFDEVMSPGGWAASGTSKVYYYYFAAGTSMAAPHVSGVAALVVGKYGHMSPALLRAILEQSSIDLWKPGSDPWTGKGRVDAVRALELE